MLAPTETPEERELTTKRTELAALEAQLTERELDLATLQAELRAFEGRYLRTVGQFFSELDELRAQVTEAEARRYPDDLDRRRRSTEARTQANTSAEAVGAAIVTDDVEFRPGDDLKRLYRQIAKLIHPDLSTSEIERARRNRFMAEANRAYSQGDEAKLRALLVEWELSPESVLGDGIGAELVRTIRKIHQVHRRLTVIDSEITILKRSDLFALKARGRIMELLMTVQPRVFSTLTPGKIIELFKLGEGTPPKLAVRTSEVVEGFFSFLGFTRLTTGGVIRKAIARGVQEGSFGYISGAVPELGSDAKYLVPLAKVRIAAGVAEDEIDLESGFIMMPQAIPLPAPAAAPDVTLTPAIGAGPTLVGGAPMGVLGPGVTPLPPPGAPLQKVVEIVFSANRNQLFAAWNAVANLADLAGKVSVSLRAEAEDGFDRSKLQNGVIEPLKEADLIE